MIVQAIIIIIKTTPKIHSSYVVEGDGCWGVCGDGLSGGGWCDVV